MSQEPDQAYGDDPRKPSTGQSHGYVIPSQSTAFSSRETIKQLPDQYRKVLMKPSPTTFTQELSKASWESVWIQLLIMVVATTVINLVYFVIFINAYNAMDWLNNSSDVFLYISIFIRAFTIIGYTLFQLILLLFFFFAGVGIQFGLARLFNGQGTFLAQMYTTLLYQVPYTLALLLITYLLWFIPAAMPLMAILVNIGLGIYVTVLNVFQIQAIHRLGGGKATGVVLISYAVVFLLLGLCILAVFSLILIGNMPR